MYVPVRVLAPVNVRNEILIKIIHKKKLKLRLTESLFKTVKFLNIT